MNMKGNKFVCGLTSDVFTVSNIDELCKLILVNIKLWYDKLNYCNVESCLFNRVLIMFFLWINYI